MKVINVCGARPNFMKIASLAEAFAAAGIDQVLVHTGQHYDQKLSDLFFEQLGIPRPDINLGVGSASHAVQTAEIMRAFEPVVLEHRPDVVVVVGDVNSTIACALVAVKLHVRVAHVEAGLRSFDRAMPEEVNRVLTDAISDRLFVSEPSGLENLRHEGAADEKVFFVGNTMIDTLLKHREKAEASDVLQRLGLAERGYAAMTLHRPSNVDDPKAFGAILGAVERIAPRLPVVFPIHPRTRKQMEASGLKDRVRRIAGLRIVDPMGYLDFLKLMAHARCVLTDSGGIQEETTILRVPCLTLRENTERPITVTVGTNRLVGGDPDRIVHAVDEVLGGRFPPGHTPELWDGRAGQRIAQVLAESP